MQPLSQKKRRLYFYALLAVFFIIIPIITLYTSGYRLDGFTLVETGGVYIYSPEVGSEIYLNGKKKRQTSIFQRDAFIQNLKPGTYEILVSREGFWPWLKEVRVQERRVAEAIAFLVPKEPNGAFIPENIPEQENATTTIPNPEYARLSALFDDAFAPQSSPQGEKEPPSDTNDTNNTDTQRKFDVVSKRNRIGLWEEDNQIFAQWLKDSEDMPNFFCRGKECSPTVRVFTSASEVRAFDFYPGRDDVILIAVSNGIFAIEIDARKNQNFQPMYKGTEPIFIVSGRNIYVRDGKQIFHISI